MVTRCRYQVSLTDMLYLPAILRASSARPRPTYWVSGNLAIGWWTFLQQAAAWTAVMALKWTFEYYMVCKPLVEPVSNILYWLMDNDVEYL